MCVCVCVCVCEVGRVAVCETDRQLTDDSIEYQCNLLHWRITSPSLFVDTRGNAHLPRDLFTRLCRLKGRLVGWRTRNSTFNTHWIIHTHTPV